MTRKKTYKPVDTRTLLGRALLSTAEWAYVARTMLRDRELLPFEEAQQLSAQLLEFERSVLGYWRMAAAEQE